MKITGYSKPNSPHLSNCDLDEINHIHARFDMIDFSKEIAVKRMELNVNKNTDV